MFGAASSDSSATHAERECRRIVAALLQAPLGCTFVDRSFLGVFCAIKGTHAYAALLCLGPNFVAGPFTSPCLPPADENVNHTLLSVAGAEHGKLAALLLVA